MKAKAKGKSKLARRPAKLLESLRNAVMTRQRIKADILQGLSPEDLRYFRSLAGKWGNSIFVSQVDAFVNRSAARVDGAARAPSQSQIARTSRVITTKRKREISSGPVTDLSALRRFYEKRKTPIGPTTQAVQEGPRPLIGKKRKPNRIIELSPSIQALRDLSRVASRKDGCDGRCRSCGAIAVVGSDYCYSCG